MTSQPAEATTLEEALLDHLSPFGWTVIRTGTDLQDRITAHGAVIRVRRTGGESSRTQTTARIGVEVFAATHDKAWEVSRQVDRALLGGSTPYFKAGGWVIDRCVNESAFAEQFYEPSVRLLVAAYRVTTRSAP